MASPARDGVALGEELVQPEGEHGPVQVRLADLCALLEDASKGGPAGGWFATGQFREGFGGLGHGGGGTSDQLAGACLDVETEGGLHPGGECVADELLMGSCWVGLLGAVDRGGELLGCGFGPRGGAGQGFADDSFGRYFGAEEAGGHVGDDRVAFRCGASAGHGGACADDLEVIGGALVAQTTHKHRHVGALAPSIGVKLIEGQEAQALGGADQVLALVRPGQDEFEHHVVGQEDVGRLGEDAASLVGALLAGVAGEGDGFAVLGVAVTQELRQFSHLGVGQRVHGVDDYGLHAWLSLAAVRFSVALFPGEKLFK